MVRQAKLWRWLRLGAFVCAVVGASAWWKVRQVSADVGERSLSIGRQLASWKDPSAGTSTLQLNGQRIAITSVSSEASVKAILDRFSALCARDSGGVTEELAALAQRGQRLPEAVTHGRFGVLRQQISEREGTAACFARDAGDGLSDLFRRVQRLVATGDFAALGQLRYVYARRSAGADTTHVISVSSLGALPLGEMFPEQGDVPGSDLFEGVRPALARRVISAELAGSKQRVVMYESELGADAALSECASALHRRGFEPGELAEVQDLLIAPARVYFKANEIVLLVATDGELGSSLSAFRLDGGGFVRMAQ